MAGNNLSPRQKMIGMMYLVLTALLALNVSKEIIHAFVTINESLEVTVSNLTAKNSQAYSAFDKQMQNDKIKTEPFYKKAQSIKKQCEALDVYIKGLKEELIRTTDGLEAGAKVVSLAEMKKQDDYDTPTRLMCGDKQDGRGHKASELKAKIIEFKKNITSSLDAGDRAKFQKRLDELFNTDDPKKTEDGKSTWEMANFYHNPVVASVALLTKTQSDIKNAESEMVTHLLTSISATDFKFDTLAPKVIAPSSYVIEGQEYSADIFLAALSSTSDPEISVGGSSLQVASGVGTYKVRASGAGEKKYAGVIKVKKPDNTFEEYKFESSYIVAKPSSSVSATAMNVIYIGIDNPIQVSVPGVPDEKVKIIPSNVVMTPDPKLGKGFYIAKATTTGEAIVKVMAEFNGKPMQMGEFKFRLKRIPSPIAKIGGKKDGAIPKAVLAAQSAIIPEMENFDFNVFSKVKSFKMSRYGKGRDPVEKSSDSNVLTAEMRDIISNCRPGDKVYFEYIKAILPDNTVRDINAITLTIQ